MKHAWVLLSVLLVAASARAAVPQQFSVQGVLRDGEGKLQSMPVQVSATLYDAQVAGAVRAGPFGPVSASAINGLFTVTFSDAALVTQISLASELWLEVQVDSDIFPRQPVTAQIYALVAASAAHADEAARLAQTCTGCVTGAQVGTGELLRSHLKAGELDHAHAPVVALASAMPAQLNLLTNQIMDLCSTACPVGSIVVGGSCTTAGNNQVLIGVVDNQVTRQHCCRFRNDAAVAAMVFSNANCLTVGSTAIP